MYKVTTIFEKPNTDVQYYLGAHPEVRARFYSYSGEDSNLLLVNVVDETPTRQVTEAFYADEAAFNSFMENFNQEFPNFFADRDAYHASVGITTTREAITV